MGLCDLFVRGELIDPDHRVVGRMAKDYCIGVSVSPKEAEILDSLQIDKEQFIYARNALLVKIFNLFFQVYSEKTKDNVNSTVNLAMTFFYKRVIEYWSSVPELEKKKMQDLSVAVNFSADLVASPERLYVTASGGHLIRYILTKRLSWNCSCLVMLRK